MIDTFTETVISVDDAAKHVGKISGKKRNRSVILRWINRGVSGVRLSAIRIGGEIFTSKEAVNEFLNQARAAKTAKHSAATSAGIKRVAVDRDLANEIDRQAAELGI